MTLLFSGERMKETIKKWILEHHPTDLELIAEFGEETVRREISRGEEEGETEKIRDRYYLTSELNLIPGTIVSVKDRFAFATVGEEEEVYISINNLKNAFLDDRVLLKKISNRFDKREEFEVVKVIFRARKELVGEVKVFGATKTLSTEKIAHSGYLFLIREGKIGVSRGQIARCKILKISAQTAVVEPIEILGDKNDVGVDVARIVLSNNAPLEFPSEVKAEVKRIPSIVSEKETTGREDFRDRLIVTIDGEDAKDFDDAVEVRKEGKIYHVGVHIADVAHYVKEGSALDKEALNRATSLYVRDRVVPMLPFELSNGICSLNPQADRLVTSCLFDVDETGRIVSSKIVKGVIRSAHRLTYTYVNRFLNEESETKSSLTPLEQMLKSLSEVASLIRKRRRKRGGLELASTELVFRMREDGFPSDVRKRKTDVGEQLIEDLMIAANEVVASTIEKKKLPMVFRIHDHPKAKKMESFQRLSLYKGYPCDVDPLTCTPSELSDYLKTISDPSDKEILSGLLLRCLAKAKYSVENRKHFGLASDSYTHFTSPIRRYPDLMVHRLIDRYLVDKNTKVNDDFKEDLERRAALSSQRERRALNIERSVEALLCAKYMSEHLGEEYDATVVSMTAQGLFVEIENGIQGFLPFESLPGDYYIFDEATYRAFGTRKGKTFSLGDRIRIICCNADIERGQVTFALLKKRRSDSENKKGKSNGRKH